MKLSSILSFTAFIGVLSLTSCNDQDKPSTEQLQSGVRNRGFKVKMTDAPGDYASLDMEINSLSTYSEGSGWILPEK